MDLQLSPAHLAFRDELRAWLRANLRRPWRDELRDPAHDENWLMQFRLIPFQPVVIPSSRPTERARARPTPLINCAA